MIGCRKGLWGCGGGSMGKTQFTFWLWSRSHNPCRDDHIQPFHQQTGSVRFSEQKSTTLGLTDKKMPLNSHTNLQKIYPMEDKWVLYKYRVKSIEAGSQNWTIQFQVSSHANTDKDEMETANKGKENETNRKTPLTLISWIVKRASEDSRWEKKQQHGIWSCSILDFKLP